MHLTAARSLILAVAALLLPLVADAQAPRTQYLLRCSGCHGADGAGSPTANVPDMRQLGQFLRLDGGREFLVKVPGVTGSGLDDAQIAAVTNWMLRELAGASVPPDFAPYTEDEIARARRDPLHDVARARAALVDSARRQGIAIP